MPARADHEPFEVDESLRRRYEQAWQSHAPPVLDDFLPAADAPGRLATLLELACIEMEQCWLRLRPGDNPPQIEEYVRRYPELGSVEATRQLIEQEIHMRRAAGQQVDYADYTRRFPDICALLETQLIEQTRLPADAALPSTIDLQPPKELGNYELLERVGEGGMGWVYRARHKRLRSLAAVKILKLTTSESRDVLARFVREGRAAASLRHPHIATAFDAGEQGQWNYIAFEFLEGENLRQIVARAGPLDPLVAISYLRQAATGLAHAHDQGIVHRDVKPANIMLERSGNIKVLDLGLAAVRSHQEWTEVTTADVLMGTVDYMAPEQGLDARRANAQSDIYSLGCTLYYLLTGKPMYEGATYMERLIAHREQPIPSLREMRSETPPALEQMYRKLVAKLPEERYATMKEVIAALDSLTLSVGEAPAPHEAPPPRVLPARVLPWKGATLVGGAVIATLVVGWLLLQGFNAGNPLAGKQTEGALDEKGVREQALKVLDLKGSFDAVVGDEKFNVVSRDQIPQRPFQITGIELQSGEVAEDALIPLLPGLKLTSLGLQGCRLTTSGLEKIVRLAPDLETLHFGGTNLSHVELGCLAELRHLQTVWIGRTGVGNDALAALAKIDSLEYLWIGETSVGDEGVHQIAALPNLHGLGLEYTQVTASGLQPLEKNRLDTLILDGLAISDADIDALARLTSLQSLSLQKTQVSDKGLARLRKLLPACDVQK